MSNEFQHRLFNYQAQPPLQSWDKITNALDQETELFFSNKLTNFQSTPPPFIWDNIAATLDENKSTPLPFRKRFAKPFRYSAAAASLIAVAVLVSLFINKKSISEGVAISPTKQNSSVSPTDEHSDTFSNGQFTRSGIYANNNKPPIQKALPLDNYHSSKLKDRTNYVVAHNYVIQKPELLDRYVIFSKAPGEAFRLSKKLFDLFYCSTRDKNCKENIRSVQRKIASPAVMASADFSGVLDLLQNMNKQ